VHQQLYLEIASPNSQVFLTREVRTFLRFDMAHLQQLKGVDFYESMRVFTRRKQRAKIERLRNRFQSAPRIVAIRRSASKDGEIN
jgi:hypothetical protein